ncbi:MAG: Aspartyl/glutamyl-tRNA(Asn/Gln) amidotransferase subunit B [Candidatus Saccharibacteria bacterium GW2011_GWA2_46_10]|nr:MAG: Aspartyl/glutamyl-tRNA(Asn/Gln) amidotransferase subunit B [Candidatus Saccharibacteria bacterium GW2011_GWA2_46_10]OGL35031.1 MAG: hypothetical protein A3F05_01720 [Candidatus Saccharibacteria bacterium RIFCSPHIGHO2_12_FULL_47_17]
MADYIPTIGVETHVQLKTKTKLFAAVGNDARLAPPNTLISHICVGMPGALPVLNRGAVELASRAAFALNTKPQKFSRFERKHYFYPDLPKGYQITQLEDSIIKGGWVEITLDGKAKRINIERANLEEDAGKNIHPEGADYTLVDLNRAGTPLLEIVSRPDINSAVEAKTYARELWLLMKYADVTDGDLYHGHVRFDVNVSVSKEVGKLGTRTETKNLNSFRSVEAAIDYEIKRQTELLERGGKVILETRGWDEAKQKTTSQRGKEEAEDYRYMPEPDVPPLELDEDFDKEIEKQMPVLPIEIRAQLLGIGFIKGEIETLLDDPDLAKSYISETLGIGPPAAVKLFGSTLIHDAKIREAFRAMNKQMKKDMVRNSMVAANASVANQINSSQYTNYIHQIAFSNKKAKDLLMDQISDEAEIEKIVAKVLSDNPKAAEDVKKGEMKAIGFLVGQVMVKSKGQANPQMAQQLIKKQLGLVG